MHFVLIKHFIELEIYKLICMQLKMKSLLRMNELVYSKHFIATYFNKKNVGRSKIDFSVLKQK